MSFLMPDAPQAPPPPPPPPAPPTFADASVKLAGQAQRAAAAAASMGGTTKTSSVGAPDPTTTKGSKSLFGG